MKKISILLLILLFHIPVFCQDRVTIISIKANVRGTPDNQGIVVTTVDKDENFELIKQKGAWFLIQTPKYVGWIHGNSIEIDKNKTFDYQKEMDKILGNANSEKKPIPKTTAILETQGDSTFKEEYIGGYTPEIQVKNDSTKTIKLIFGGIT